MAGGNSAQRRNKERGRIGAARRREMRAQRDAANTIFNVSMRGNARGGVRSLAGQREMAQATLRAQLAARDTGRYRTAFNRARGSAEGTAYARNNMLNTGDGIRATMRRIRQIDRRIAYTASRKAMGKSGG